MNNKNHPGEILKNKYLIPFGFNQTELAGRLGISAASVSELINKQKSVTVEMSLLLAKFFGTTDDFWYNAQRKYDASTISDLFKQTKSNANFKQRLSKVKVNRKKKKT